MTTADEALLPCPWCGCAEVSVREGATFRWRFAACNECEARGPEVRVPTAGEMSREEWEAKTAEIAIAAWNTRAPDPRLLDLLAVIHRDGGHHTEAVGLEQSVTDAMRLVCGAHLPTLDTQTIGTCT